MYSEKNVCKCEEKKSNKKKIQGDTVGAVNRQSIPVPFK